MIDNDGMVSSSHNAIFDFEEDKYNIFVTLYDHDGNQIAISEGDKSRRGVYIADIWRDDGINLAKEDIDKILKIYIAYAKKVHKKTVSIMLVEEKGWHTPMEYVLNKVSKNILYRPLRENGFKTVEREFVSKGVLAFHMVKRI